ncbi:MAG: ABC transporter substrate-binding protein [Treponema sp.]|nr:ABC transporter substrate-binding protein [Treponema sp.]
MKKIIAIFSALFVLFAFSSCNKKTSSRDKAKAQTRIIKDHNGREVEIPAEINRIVIGSILPLASVYCMYMGSTEKLVGMHPSSMAAAKNSYLATVFPEVTKIDSSFVQNGVINIEELLKLKPDVVFYSATNDEERQIYENAGIPAVGFSTVLSGYNSVETYADWISLLGDIFGDTGRASKIIEEGRNVQNKILERVNKLDDSQKPRVLILFNYDDSNMTAAGSNFFSEYWIGTAGGINVAKDFKGQGKINMEQVYEWNPDMIFITNFSPRLAEDLLENKIEGTDWSLVKAVKEGKVYKFPLGMYRWFPPASDTPLVLQWLATKMQPELFKDIDMDKEIKDYYKKYYSVDLTDSDIQKIYSPARAASGK